MRTVNKIIAYTCFVLCGMACIGIIVGATHQIFLAIATLLVGLAHLADNQKPVKR